MSNKKEAFEGLFFYARLLLFQYGSEIIFPDSCLILTGSFFCPVAVGGSMNIGSYGK